MRSVHAPAGRNRVLDAGLLVAIACILGLFSSRGRPIWTDEFLHFAMGGLSSVGDALSVIRDSTSKINHGQTGAYLFADFVLLKIFGASDIALRLPSIVSAAFMLVAALMFLRGKGIGYVGQYAALLALAAQSMLMHYTGEARPYMPLAAATVGVLAYYSETPADRQRPAVRAVGWIAVVLGTLMHPFFPMYWVAVVVFAYMTRSRTEGEALLSRRAMLDFVNVPLAATGAAIAIALGALTWMQGAPEFSFEPFEITSASGGFMHNFVAASHFQFLPLRGKVLVFGAFVPFVALAVYPFLPARLKSELRDVVPPVALMSLALALSLLITGLSYARHYWIVPRQWIASQAIVPLACVWLLVVCVRLMLRRNKPVATVVAVLGLVVVAAFAGRVALQQVRYLRSWNGADSATAQPGVATPESGAAGIDRWLEQANDNIGRGGPVSPVFAEFYGR